MNETLKRELIRWFIGYSHSFIGGNQFINQNIMLKRNHSFRVFAHAHQIGESLKLDQAGLYLTEISALFHDIGRFEQFKRYRTFNDGMSTNHGELGVIILLGLQILEILAIDESEKILNVLLFHNKRVIPPYADRQSTILARIVRDADKLDILRILCPYYGQRGTEINTALELDLPDIPGISPEVLEDIYTCRSVGFEHVRSVNDFKLVNASWIFDLNFQYSLRYFHKMDYLNKILKTLPPGDMVEKLHRHLTTALHEKL